MVQRNLVALHSFLEGNPHLFHSATGDYSGARAAPASDQEAWKVDNSIFFTPFNRLTHSVFPG
jgi:nuclear pore complex protein Nup155